jgi:hypothetical protein
MRIGNFVLRSLALCLAVFLLTACNEVTGDSSGGVIEHFAMHMDGPGPFDNYTPQWLLDFRDRHTLTATDLLQIANSHCQLYGRRAKINDISGGKIHFKCT